MIVVENLKKHFGDTYAVRGISFEVKEGDIFGFIGPNGAGKTTTIRMLSTLEDPTSGRLFIDGIDVINRPEEVRNTIGYMPDYFGVYENITVREYLDFFASAYKIPSGKRPSIMNDVLALVDMEPLADRMVSTLSKGMKQRLCLAKTLLHNPRVLILDEPASGLDPRARIEIRALLKELSNMGKTIFISSHILTELSDIVDTVGIIEKGELLAFGAMAEISKKLRKSTRLRLEFAYGFGRALELLEKNEYVLGAEEKNGKIYVDFNGTPNEVYLLVKSLVNEDIPLCGLAEEADNLEGLFMKITRGDLG